MAISDEYKEYLHSDDWKKKRREVLRRARHRCGRCGRQATQVHHRTYERIFEERLTDLEAICADCHQKIHDPRNGQKKVFGKLGLVLARIIR